MAYRENRADTVLSALWTIQVVFLKSRLYNRPGQNASLFCGGSFGGGENKKSASRFSLIAREKFRSRKSPDANRMWAQPTANWVQAQPASLRYPSPKNSPSDCFYSRISASAVGSFESPSFQFDKKSDPTKVGSLFWRKERDSLRYPSPKNSPPDCFCGRNFVSAAGSFESPSFQFIKKVTPLGGITFLAEREGFEPSVPL